MTAGWLAAPTVAALRDGLRLVAPELAGGVIVPRGLEPEDALWRAEAGVALPDGRAAADWVDDLEGRLAAVGLRRVGQGSGTMGMSFGQTR
ncbi:hypothetical protein AB0M02_28830 [Actinoplanes sp. NPDC051861]|uniref:hypothetical protein n=1 Tax=Actinoplanes sp. NPDC051861 TaxID=3155170 RepID=UPI00342C20F7